MTEPHIVATHPTTVVDTGEIEQPQRTAPPPEAIVYATGLPERHTVKAPAMTQSEIDEHPFATHRVTCHLHGICLYAGDREPQGGAAAVAAAAGCPPWHELARREVVGDLEAYDGCPAAAAARPTNPA